MIRSSILEYVEVVRGRYLPGYKKEKDKALDTDYSVFKVLLVFSDSLSNI